MKRIQVLVVTALFMVIASCTTNQAALLPPLPEVEAHVVSGVPAPRRNVASTADASGLEAEFQSVLASDDVDKAARLYVDRVARIFYRTQGLLSEYDSKLDDVSKRSDAPEGALLTDDSYARLIAAWSLRQEMLEKIVYFYKRSLQDHSDRSMLLARAVRNGVLSAANSTNRLAKQDLLRELIEVHNDKRLAKDGESANFVLKGQLIDGPKDMLAFYGRNERQLDRETEAAKGDQEINAEIERLLPDAKAQLNDQFQKRTPQSAGAIAPGLGQSGMMNGFEFPRGTWALTFDDGPHENYTRQALANLKANHMKATFFWVANNVSRFPWIVQQAIDAGMTLANHSYTHANLPHLGAQGLTHEIIDSTTVDLRAGFKPKFFRCPYGACGSQTSAVRQKIAALDMVSVTWNVDSLDWQDKNPTSVYNRVKKQMAVQKRGIILFHDIHPQSMAASKMLMADFEAGQKKGIYRTVTLDQAFNELNSPEGMK